MDSIGGQNSDLRRTTPPPRGALLRRREFAATLLLAGLATVLPAHAGGEKEKQAAFECLRRELGFTEHASPIAPDPVGQPAWQEGSCVVFFVRARSARPPVLLSEANAFNPHEGGMTPITGTDWFCREESLPSDARIEYSFADTVAEWLDEGNADFADSFGRKVSVWRDRDWPADPLASAPPAEPGRIESLSLPSAARGNTRLIQVYLPPGYDADAEKRYPAVYIQDGEVYASAAAGYPAVFDRLIGSGTCWPFIAVFVPPVERRVEYRGSPEFRRFYVDELVRLIDERWRTDTRRVSRTLLGHSRGGLGTLDLAAAHTTEFGYVVVFAPAVGDVALFEHLSVADGPRQKIIVVECRYDALWRADAARVVTAQSVAGHEVVAMEASGGHNITTWRTWLPRVLARFLPPEQPR